MPGIIERYTKWLNAQWPRGWSKSFRFSLLHPDRLIDIKLNLLSGRSSD